MIRAAVIGVGAMGKNHARVYKEIPDVELAAIADINLEFARKLYYLSDVPAYNDYRKMLEHEKPDAVSVAVPTCNHYSIVSDLLENGYHVLVEKPIAATREEAEALIEIARQTGRILMVGHIERFNPAVIELKRRIDAGQLGRIFQIHTRRLGPFPSHIVDVGVILDLAPHDLDIMFYLTGQKAVRLYAEANRELHSRFEDIMTGIIRFENGVLGILEINWLTPTKIRELFVTGERGMFRVDFITQDLYFFENALAQGDAWHPLRYLNGIKEGAMTRYAINKAEPLRVELETFTRYIQTGTFSATNCDEACAALELALTMIDVSRKGTVMDRSDD